MAFALWGVVDLRSIQVDTRRFLLTRPEVLMEARNWMSCTCCREVLTFTEKPLHLIFCPLDTIIRVNVGIKLRVLAWVPDFTT